MYVTNVEQLARFVEHARSNSFVAFDTEFIREKTYYARLCLIQLASAGQTAIVDPFVIDDLSALYDLLADEGVVKVVHAGSQDLEIFHRLMDAVPRPVFDTQIAATLAGFPTQVGYASLVKELLGHVLDKSDTFTDWSRRPLSDTQIEYARNDVLYLPSVYERLTATLEAEGRLEWLIPDFSRLVDVSTYEVVPEEQWRRLKRVSSLRGHLLAVAREVTAWREREAQRRDIPRRWVLGDEAIVEIARRSPRTREQLCDIRGIGDKLPKSAYDDVLAAVQRGLAYSADEIPALVRRRRPARDIDAAVDMMVAVVRARAAEHDVAMPLLASREDLARLACGQRDDHPLLEGWRRDMVGDELVEVLEGRIALRLVDGALSIEPGESAS